MVGIPNAGKSTLFNALMKEARAHAANFPFCTIKPNIGSVPIPDKRLDALEKIVNPERVVPVTLECVDIAGLVAGASKGEGQGNRFLSDINKVDLILHVVRTFAEPGTGESATPMDDVQIIEMELLLYDMQILENILANEKKHKEHAPLARKLLAHLNSDKHIRELVISGELSDDDQAWIRQHGLLTIKPTIYVCNIQEDDINKELEIFDQLRQRGLVATVCARLQYELSQIPDQADRDEMLEYYGLTEDTMNELLRTSYKALNLFTYFTAGEKEVRAWQIKANALAPEAAGVIHTDFQRGFISAEVVSYEDFIVCKGWNGAKTAGKSRTEGKQYKMQDGDICLFRYNV